MNRNNRWLQLQPITDERLKPIADKVLAGERLSHRRRHRCCIARPICWRSAGSRITCAKSATATSTYFNVNRHINPTNVCVAHCKLCAFGRDPDAPGAYTFALEEIYQRAEQGVREGATEFHIVGGLHPDLPFDHYLEMMRGLKQRCPGSASQSVHDGGGALFLAHRQDFHRRTFCRR